nr:hypothetical protein [Tanacetum cinerariifolium]
MPHDSPLPRVNTLGSDEGSMTLNELTVLCTKLSQKVESLEPNLKQTKKVYGAAYTKLIMKVKKLEKSVKSSQVRRRAKIVVYDDDELEDPSKQGRSIIEKIDQDAEVYFVTPTQVNTQGETQIQESQPKNQLGFFSAAKVLVEVAKIHTYTRRRRTISTANGGISTAEESVSTDGASMPVSTAEGSKGFHQIVDFLNSSHIKYALTENPIIYTSLIQQFWKTAAANTLDIGEVKITATIDGKVKLVNEASIRRHIKLEDSDARRVCRGVGYGMVRDCKELVAILGGKSREGDKQFKFQLWINIFAKIFMLHVLPGGYEFNGEIIPCSDFRLEYRNEFKIDKLKGNFNCMSIEINKKEKLQQLEQVANLSTDPFNSFCYDDDDDEDYTFVITLNFLITDSLIMENEHLDTILKTESDEFIKSSIENLVPITKIIFIEFNPIHNDDLDSTLKNDCFDTKSYLLESLLNRDTSMTSSPKFDSFLEEFFGELAHTNLIPPRINEAFSDDHVKEISSGSTTTHYDYSLYDLFIFDLSINPFPPADRSDFYEFTYVLTHIVSPPKYDCVCFKIEPNSGDFTMDVVDDTFPTR